MKSMEARELKFSFLTESTSKNQNYDNSLHVNGTDGEDFSVDAFLNLSSDELSEESSECMSYECGSNYLYSNSLDSWCLPNIEANVDDFDDLEWLSRILDDTSISYPIIKPPKNQGNPILAAKKSRTKRGRINFRKTWRSSSSSSDQSVKQRKVKELLVETEDEAPQMERKCTHCEVRKTPQWRRGPFGPKTLCNACGVRYKSGRLFPEYRPAGSPSFSDEIHSNSHRKVLELRKNSYERAWWERIGGKMKSLIHF